MKDVKKENRGITLVSLVVTIIILIILAGVSINMTLGEGGLITIAKRAKENMELAQIEEQEKLNELYMQFENDEGITGGEINYDIIAKLNNFKKAIADYIEEAGGEKPDYTADTITFGEKIKGIVAKVTEKTTAEEPQILQNYIAYSKGKLRTGTMVNQGAKTASLNAGGSYTIPAGYHNGQGKITANSLASQTQGTATAEDILTGKTAWVNGNKITGNKEEKTDAEYYFMATGANGSEKYIRYQTSYTVKKSGILEYNASSTSAGLLVKVNGVNKVVKNSGYNTTSGSFIVNGGDVISIDEYNYSGWMRLATFSFIIK